MRDKIIQGFALLVVVISIAGLIYVGWYIKREVNAWLYYDDSTKEMVCKMVKPEYLKEGVCDE